MEWIEGFSTSRIADREDGAFPMGVNNTFLLELAACFGGNCTDRRRVCKSTDLASILLFAHVIAHLRRRYFSHRGTSNDIACHTWMSYDYENDSRLGVR